MSSQLRHKSFLVLVLPLVMIVAIIIGIVTTIGIEDFGKLLLNKNPMAIAVVASAIGTVLFLLHKLESIT